MTNEDFVAAEGFCTEYWGLALEDDEFRVNMIKHGLKIDQPQNVTAGFLRIQSRSRANPQKCLSKGELHRERPPNTGLEATKYSIESVVERSIDGARFTMLNVQVPCDRENTPWCDCDA